MATKRLVTLRKYREFKALYDGDRGTVKGISDKHLVVLIKRNGLDRNRFGITAGRKVGKAVVRNKVRRRVREILRNYFLSDKNAAEIVYMYTFDFVIIIKPSATGIDFWELNGGLKRLLDKQLKPYEKRENYG